MFDIQSVCLWQVEQFWHLYTYMNRPDDMGTHVDVHIFKDGIRPMWEVRQTS